MNSYLGYMWWDKETDGELMYPDEQPKLTDAEERRAVENANPEGSARARALVRPRVPRKTGIARTLNPQLKQTQFADFHGHGWVFRAVFKHDRKGNLLDSQGNVVKDRRAQRSPRP